jgi:hypothetical protein
MSGCNCWVQNESREVQFETPYFAHDATCAKYRDDPNVDPVDRQNVLDVRTKAQHILNGRKLRTHEKAI